LVRIFIIQHDQASSSLSRQANDLLANACGIFTLTPYHFEPHPRGTTSAAAIGHRGQGDIGRLDGGRVFCARASAIYRLYCNRDVCVWGGFLFLIVSAYARHSSCMNANA
jgi:hypothetical protein